MFSSIRNKLFGPLETKITFQLNVKTLRNMVTQKGQKTDLLQKEKNDLLIKYI